MVLIEKSILIMFHQLKILPFLVLPFSLFIILFNIFILNFLVILFHLLFYLLSKNITGDMTLLNTKFELSMPGFMNIDFVNQIRKEEKIGGGGTSAIYRGLILDPKLKEVTFFLMKKAITKYNFFLKKKIEI